MANIDNPNGFVPVRGGLGGATEITTNEYSIASAYATSIFTNDPVKTTGTGRNIAIAAAGETARGVFRGCSYVDATGEQKYSKYWPASTVATNIIAHVVDDPNTVFSIQGDGAVVEADINQMCDWVAGTGTTATGISAYELDSSEINTTGGLHILGLDRKVGNAYGTNARVLVQFNEHELKGTQTAT